MGAGKISEPEVAALRMAIEPGWDAATAWRGKWNSELPSTNQCAVTAMLVQDLYGGHLIATTMDGVPHYYNRIDGQDLDLTLDQFRPQAVRGSEKVVSRSQLNRYSDTMRRYCLLRARVGEAAAALPQLFALERSRVIA